jgi:hypothetical protein
MGQDGSGERGEGDEGWQERERERERRRNIVLTISNSAKKQIKHLVRSKNAEIWQAVRS